MYQPEFTDNIKMILLYLQQYWSSTRSCVRNKAYNKENQYLLEQYKSLESASHTNNFNMNTVVSDTLKTLRTENTCFKEHLEETLGLKLTFTLFGEYCLN